MPHRDQEVLIGTITFISTIITGDFIADLLVGIIVYSSSRLFYYYFNNRIKRFINKLKFCFNNRVKLRNKNDKK